MSYIQKRHEILRKLGIERSPAQKTADTIERSGASIFGDLPVHTMPVPGRKCPQCLTKGQTVWVIPGKRCPQCGTQVN